MKRKIPYILLISLVLWLPMVAGGVYAQTKPKTLKELVAEEKAAKEAERKAREAEKAKEEAEKAKEEAENIKYESILPVLNALEKEDLEDVCRDLGIVFNVQKPAKEALKEEFWNGTNDTKNKIAKALKAKQKSANP